MNRHAIVVAAVVVLALGPAVSTAQSSGWAARGAPTGGPCQSFSQLSATVTAAAGLTNGIIGPVQPGESFQLSVAGPGTGTFRIVGDPAGTVTYAGPANVPATLSYTVTTATPPVGAVGVGYFFTAGAGTVTITASCTRGGIPSLDAWGRTLLGLLVALGGIVGVAFMRRRARAS
jgi:hypothetical protein